MQYVGVVVVGALVCICSSLASGGSSSSVRKCPFAVYSSCRSSSPLYVVAESREGVAVIGLVVVVDSRGSSPW